MRIRAAVLREMGRPTPYARSRPLELADVELDGPGPGELLLKIGAAGLCHSDLSVIDGSRPRPMPMVLGHEAGGTVVATGPGVRRFQAGDRVVVDAVASKLELAERIADVTTLAATDDVVDRVRAATGGGADCAIETVGSAEVLAQAYAATRRGGSTIAVGLPHPERMLTIPAVSLVAEERTLRGSYLGSMRLLTALPGARRSARPWCSRTLPRAGPSDGCTRRACRRRPRCCAAPARRAAACRSASP